MSASRKIATCSYCGTRAVLVLDRARHELTCSACGAPLHDMKFMPQREDRKSLEKPVSSSRPRYKPAPYEHEQDTVWSKGARRKKKKRKPFFGRMLEELWDEVEDFFD